MSDKLLELLPASTRPAPEFWSLDDTAYYCDRFATQFYKMAIDLDIAEAVVRMMITQLPTGTRGKISRAKARSVARHLGKAADSYYDSAASMEKVMVALRKALAKRIERGHDVEKKWTP